MKRNVLQMIAAAGLGFAVLAYGQTAPSGPTPQNRSQAIPPNQAPLQLSTPGQAPTPKPITFPPPNPKNFTATTPSMDTVNAFLKQLWGFDPNRKWQVEAIQKTEAPGLSRVIIFVGEEGSSNRPGETAFFVTPDGQHLIAGGQVMPFPDPFAATRTLLEEKATGPYRGAASKKLLLVEFADLQCPHCKEAEPTMERLEQDFPTARIVFQNFPINSLHPAAEQAAEYGVCVAQLKGNDAFFKYVQAVFDTQAGLTPADTDKTLADAVTKAGADPAAVKTCVASPATKAAVDASRQLGVDVGVNETPMLVINGRPLAVNSVPYATLRQLVSYESSKLAAQSSTAAPSLRTKP
ncbi:MAG TPA: thioredoxin domain-containing protein [Acidobacteriaceae bacterium]|jgi:protein-disulfide isomerase|nr:thioredoxin domain-containing protein [Acidobacteriaceae bacterium]